MLDWSLVDLARAAGVSVSAVMAVEGRRPGKRGDSNSSAIQAAFEAAGMSFTHDDGDGDGLKLRHR